MNSAVATGRLPPKMDVLNALLEHTSVLVHLDPRPPEVLVPNWFKKQPQLALQIGLNLPLPIKDLEITEHGVSCTLSFSRTPHFCSLPWSAVYALVGENGRGMVWPDDIPPEVAVAQQQAKRPEQSTGGNRSNRSSRARGKAGRLKAVAGGVQSVEAVEATNRGAEPGDVPREAHAVAGAESEDGAERTLGAEEHTVQASPGKAPRPSYLRVVK